MYNESQEIPYGAYYRQQKNVNPLLPNKFTFFLTKLPEVSMACKSANIPGTSLPEVRQLTSLNPIIRSGLNLEFEPLEIEFIVDEDMNNYLELANWMRRMALTKDSDSYSQIKNETLQPGPDGGLVSDAQLVVLNNESVPNVVFYFRNAFPTALGAIHLTNDTEEPTAMISTARFAYTYYDFSNIDPTADDENNQSS